jgi:hypothetical protein
MADHMGGIAVMGGPATGLLVKMQAPKVAKPDTGGMDHGAMQHGQAPRRPPRRTQRPWIMAARQASATTPESTSDPGELHASA